LACSWLIFCWIQDILLHAIDNLLVNVIIHIVISLYFFILVVLCLLCSRFVYLYAFGHLSFCCFVAPAPSLFVQIKAPWNASYLIFFTYPCAFLPFWLSHEPLLLFVLFILANREVWQVFKAQVLNLAGQLVFCNDSLPLVPCRHYIPPVLVNYLCGSPVIPLDSHYLQLICRV
jgi:hypothetical protein